MVSCDGVNPQVSGSCTSSITTPTIIKNVEPEKERSVGGYLVITQDNQTDVGLTHDERKYCTVKLQFHGTSSDPEGFLPVTFWSAKHCIKEAYTNSVALTLQLRQEKPGAEPEVKRLEFNSQDIRIHALMGMRTLKESIGLTSNTAYKNFAESYESLKRSGPDELQEVRDLAITQRQGEGDHAIEMDGGFVRYLKEMSEQRNENEGQPFCYDQKDALNHPQKICFTHADLAAFEGRIKANAELLDLAAEQTLNNYIAASELLDKENGSQATAWISVDMTTQPKPGMRDLGEGWRRLFTEEHKTLAAAALAKCEKTYKGACPAKDAVVRAFGLLPQSEDPLLAYLANVLDRHRLWSDMRRDFLDQLAVDQLHLHLNLQTNPDRVNDAIYEAVSFDQVAPNSGDSRSLKKIGDGLVLYNSLANPLHFFKKDSGTIISIGGVLPILALSTINNDDASGGLPHAPPQTERMPSDSKVYQDPSQDIVLATKPTSLMVLSRQSGGKESAGAPIGEAINTSDTSGESTLSAVPNTADPTQGAQLGKKGC
jgi:hypothetical protein